MTNFPRTGDADADAMAVRRHFLAAVSPEELACFDKATDPRQRREIFWRTFFVVGNVLAGNDLPEEAFKVSCAPPSPARRVGASAWQLTKESFNQLLSDAFRAPGITDLSVLVTALARAGGPSAAALDEPASARLLANGEIVTLILGAEAGARFPGDPPRQQATQFLRAGVIAVTSRTWPTSWMLGYADAADGGAMQIQLQRHYGGSHPDAVGWATMSEEQRGLAVQRLFADLFTLGLAVAEGTAPMARFIKTLGSDAPRDNREVVRSVYGSAGLERYDRAVEYRTPADDDYSAENIVNAAILMRYSGDALRAFLLP